MSHMHLVAHCDWWHMIRDERCALQVYAASIMFGYFVRRVDKRFQLERSLGLLPQNQEEAVARLERLFSQVQRPVNPAHGPANAAQVSLLITRHRRRCGLHDCFQCLHACSCRRRLWMEQMTPTHHPAARRPPQMHHHRASPPASPRRIPASRRPRPLGTSRHLEQSRPRARRSGYPCESACLCLPFPHFLQAASHLALGYVRACHAESKVNVIASDGDLSHV